jgi:protein TonB
MRPAWLFLSLLAHAAVVGGTLGFAVGIGRQPLRPPPRVELQPTQASSPAAAAAMPAPDVRAEVAVVDPLPPDPLVLPPLEPPAAPARLARQQPPQPPSLQRLVPAASADAAPPPLTAPAAEPVATVEPVRCADNEPPHYPASDRQLGHEGRVVLTVRVDARGAVVDVVLAAPCPFPGLNREAMRAVRRWRFEPARRHGQPVAGETRIVIEFRLRDGAR